MAVYNAISRMKLRLQSLFHDKRAIFEAKAYLTLNFFSRFHSYVVPPSFFLFLARKLSLYGISKPNTCLMQGLVRSCLSG